MNKLEVVTKYKCKVGNFWTNRCQIWKFVDLKHWVVEELGLTREY